MEAPKRQVWDLLVAGAGPAGVAVASAAAAAGLQVLCVAPDPHAGWPNNYGSWCKPLADLGLTQVFGQTWSTARVVISDTQSICLPQPYGQVDNEKLRASLVAQGEPQWLAAQVDAVTGSPGAQEVHTINSGVLQAQLVIDATGPPRPLLTGQPPAAQRAVGWWIEVDEHPYPLDEVGLMDWRGPTRDLPSFLYVMPQDPSRLFVEETILATRSTVDDSLLEQRMATRLQSLGIQVRHIHRQEHCTIPLDAVIPERRGNDLAIGAAAALVHPASGYMLPRALKAAPQVVQALTEAWDDGPEAALKAARRTLWPTQARQLHALQTLGLEVLLGLDQAGSQAFFSALCALDARDWQSLMGTATERNRVTGAMSRLFLTAPNRVRGSLLRPCLRSSGRQHLLRAFTPGRS